MSDINDSFVASIARGMTAEARFSSEDLRAAINDTRLRITNAAKRGASKTIIALDRDAPLGQGVREWLKDKKFSVFELATGSCEVSW